MATKTLMAPCQKCCGTGRVPLSEELSITLACVKAGRRVTVEGVAGKLKWKGTPNAIHNRLEDLRAMGFVTRERQSKFFYYSPAK